MLGRRVPSGQWERQRKLPRSAVVWTSTCSVTPHQGHGELHASLHEVGEHA